MRTMVLLAAHIWRTQQRYRPTASTTIRILFPSFFQLEDDQQTQRRHFSSRKRNNNSFQLDAVPFRVSPQEAYTQFQHWADKEQGLGPFLNIGGPIGSAAISAAYTPFWYFDLNIRFVPPSSSGSSRRDNRTNYGSNFIPEPFKSAYPNAPNGIIHVPGLASYAGFSYHRSLIDPIHNTTPIFLQKDITPFGNWMLEPLKANTTITGGKEMIDIFPDPWNATRERSLNVIYEELVEMVNEQYSESSNGYGSNKVQVEIERLRARRIYMPTYIVDYKILGIAYRGFISGCDSSVSVSGTSHRTIFSDSAEQSTQVFRGASIVSY